MRDLSNPTRRRLLAAAAFAPLAGCGPAPDPALQGGWVGANAERGHRLRELGIASKSGAWPTAASAHRCGVIVVGAGIAGLGAARTLAQRGIDDVHVFDLEDAAGGNARGHSIAGIGCPLGAHYLPVPGDDAHEVIELLESLGLRRLEHGRAVYDERDLCASPQERLFIDGHWRDGLLPPLDALPAAERADTRAQYRRFERAVEKWQGYAAFTMPTARAAGTDALDALDRSTFSAWLDAQGLVAPALRWYLDYCCRDDYGAGSGQVSAWAGLHYFASRHGFRAPLDNGSMRGDPGDDTHDALLTWPEGNGHLSARMAAPLGARLHTGLVALRVEESRHEVGVDLWNAAERRIERWTAPQVVLAVPLFIAARLIAAPPAALAEAAARQSHVPWLVANLHIDAPLADVPGAPPSWDNVIYQSDALGYVDAMHQSTLPHAGPTVLTAYWALGGDNAAQSRAARQRLLGEPWQHWATSVIDDLSVAHRDLRGKLRRIDLMRYGHAMAVPSPGQRSSAALRALAEPQRRVHYAHSDLSAYSVFEEALYHGCRAAAQAARA